MWLGLKPFLALTLAVTGGAAGYGIAHSLRAYSAEFSLPVEPFVYRMAEAKIVAVDELRKFATAAGKSEQREFSLLETQLLNGAKVVEFESTPRLSKRDWRDAPDGMLQKLLDTGTPPETIDPDKPRIAAPPAEISDSAMLNGKFLDAVVRAKAETAEEAVRLTQFAMDFFRYAVHESVLREHLVRWGPVARSELATISDRMTKTASLLDSLDLKIAAMQELTQRNKDLPQFPAPYSSGVQLQVNTLKALSPAQQIVAFESERIEAISRDREDRLNAAYLTLMISIADEYTPKLDAGQSPQSISDEIVGRLAELTQAQAPTERFAAERARTTVDIALTDLDARWLSARTEPEAPLARPTGIPRSIGLLAGIVAGLALWFLIMMRRQITLAARRFVSEPL